MKSDGRPLICYGQYTAVSIEQDGSVNVVTENLPPNAGPWVHLDGTPCPTFYASKSFPSPHWEGRGWWCTEHQQYVTGGQLSPEQQLRQKVGDMMSGQGLRSDSAQDAGIDAEDVAEAIMVLISSELKEALVAQGAAVEAVLADRASVYGEGTQVECLIRNVRAVLGGNDG